MFYLIVHLTCMFVFVICFYPKRIQIIYTMYFHEINVKRDTLPCKQIVVNNYTGNTNCDYKVHQFIFFFLVNCSKYYQLNIQKRQNVKQNPFYGGGSVKTV